MATSHRSRRISDRFPRTLSQGEAERSLRVWFGILSCWFVWGVSGCGSSPLPPPPSSSPPTPTVQPMVVPARVSSVPPKAKSRAPQAESSTTVASAPSEAKSSPANPIAPSSTLQSGPPATMGQTVDGPAAAGNFIMSLCRDLEGNLWVGTEDQGVLRGTPDGKWTQFTTKDGLGDDNGYAICCDRLGRVWVGQLNHGVAVFNGETWKTYDVLDGPLGERIFDIACCPTDGDVWMATSAGLSRYSEGSRLAPRDEARPSRDPLQRETPTTPETSTAASRGVRRPPWSYFTRADGLPSDQANALAFAADGTLYVGTQCDGVAIAKPDDNYSKWQVVTGNQSDTQYRQPQGTGLPSPLINDVLVARDGTVYVATSLGLAKSKNRGQSWEYIRGRDYADKVKGRFEPPPKTWSPLPNQKLAALLPEDYITCLAEDDAGRLWLGFRQQGALIVGPKPDQVVSLAPSKDGLKHDWVSAICPLPNGEAWIGGFGQGVTRWPTAAATTATHDKGNAASKSDQPKPDAPITLIPPHPSRVVPPTVGELQVWLDRMMANKPATGTQPQPHWGVYRNDDWATRGDWFGRLGNQRATLCAAGSPLDHTLGGDPEWYQIHGAIGPHGTKHEALRHWLHWKKTDERRVLHDPIIGYRREAEWDDHGESYSMSHEGPDVWVGIEVPEGLHQVSLYFVNPNGHDGANRFRDYLLELKAHTGGSVARLDKSPTLARARVQHFWGGVYKSFLVKGPNKYGIKIDRNASFNTIVSGVFLDRIDGPKNPYDKPPLPMMGFDWQPPAMPKYWEDEDASDNVLAIVKIKEAADAARRTTATPHWHRTIHLLCLRALLADKTTPKEVIGNWRWHLQIWSEKDRQDFDHKMKIAWAIMCRINPSLEKADF